MFDTRAGFWLQAIVGLLTAGVVVLFCDPHPRRGRASYATCSASRSRPRAILLPIVGILLVSSEWSQRTNLITFTLVPQRMRVMNAKLVAGVLVGVVVLIRRWSSRCS